MAKLTVDGSNNGAGDGFFAMLASCGVLLCMITALMGIKIWWFKHRLSFDHSRTNNGAAGRATPTVPLRTHSSRHKRISQEIHESVEVHGIFRRRQENDLDIVQTKQLPPVRIRNLSQSTPSIFPLSPPRREDKVHSSIYEEYEPPTREAPRPPIESPQPPTPTISLVEEMPTFDELELKYRQMEMKETESDEFKRVSNESILRMRESPPHPPRRLNRHSYNEEKVKVGMHKFMKMKLPSAELAQSLQNVNERRATGYLRPDEEHINIESASTESSLNELKPIRSHSVEEFGERRPTGYIKFEEIDADGLEDFRQKWERLQTSFGKESPILSQSIERIDYETIRGHKYDHINRASAEPYTEKNPFVEREERQSWKIDEPSHHGTPVSQKSIDFTSDEEFADELGGFQPKSSYRTKSRDGEVFDDLAASKSPDVRPFSSSNTVTSPNAKLVADLGEENMVRTRRPIKPEQLWDELEANIKQDEHEKRLWHEIEKDLDLNRDFASNIEEEFDKIRHSYEENEAAFLDNNCKLKRIPKQVLITSPEPEGFGKSIDEDWESFEKLAENQPQRSQLAEADKSVVQFNLSDLEDAYDSEPMLREERRPAGFLRNSRKFIRELSNIEDADEPTSPINNASVIEFEELNIVVDDNTTQSPAADTGSQNVTNFNDDYVHEHNKESIFEPAEEPLNVQTQARARPRPRQKVTFDISSTEYIQATGEEGGQGEGEGQEEHSAGTSLSAATKYTSSDYNPTDDDSTPTVTLPKPMQRITKIHYTSAQYNADSSNNAAENEILALPSLTSSPAPVPLLFGTQISLAEAETDIIDSWSAIRQRKEITTTCTSTSPLPETPIKCFNIVESPTPAYRSAVAHQPSTISSVTLTEERVVTEHYVSGFKPHAATRKQYFEQSEFNATEA